MKHSETYVESNPGFFDGNSKKIATEMPPEGLELIALYPPPVRDYPAVEYLPGKRVAERQVSLRERFAETDACLGNRRKTTWEE